MTARWQHYLGRWTDAGLIDAASAERVRAYERKQEEGLGWPVLLVIGLGVLLLGAGILLFVAAHWDRFSPQERFGAVLTLVGVFHVAGAILARRSPLLALGLHFVGTISLGAGIFLAGQIFHLQEHWPGGVMLWAVGAAVAWLVLRDWAQSALVAVLVPVWLGGEWVQVTGTWIGHEKILAAGIVLLAISYLTALTRENESSERYVLALIGGIALIPCTAVLVYTGAGVRSGGTLPGNYWWFGWVVAVGGSLLFALWLRRGAVWMNGVAAVWVVLLSWASAGFGAGTGKTSSFADELLTYGLCGLGALGLIAWGLKESRTERINLGVVGFALTIFVFYFSNVMDKLGRAASLVGLGLLFLLGGWVLEKARRRLVAQVGARS